MSAATLPVSSFGAVVTGLPFSQQPIDNICVECAAKQKSDAALLQGPYARAVQDMVAKGATKAIAEEALLFASDDVLAPNPDLATVALATRVAQLFTHVSKILATGVLSPERLKELNLAFTSSSDTTLARHISALDIDMDRNVDDHYGEAFPNPGHQSVWPLLERQNDIQTLGERMLQLARAKNANALSHLAKIQANERHAGTAEEFIALATADKSINLVPRLGLLARFDPGGLRGLGTRAMNSAMIISSGTPLTESDAARWLKAPGLGPRVAEMRAETTIAPAAMTHVLLPDYMRGFAPLGGWAVPVIFVGTVTTRARYYDHQSRVDRGNFDLSIPDYESAIARLISDGKVRKMLTHSTNV